MYKPESSIFLNAAIRGCVKWPVRLAEKEWNQHEKEKRRTEQRVVKKETVANIQDYHGGRFVLLPLKDRFPRLKHIWADSGYNNAGFVAWVKKATPPFARRAGGDSPAWQTE